MLHHVMKDLVRDVALYYGHVRLFELKNLQKSRLLRHVPIGTDNLRFMKLFQEAAYLEIASVVEHHVFGPLNYESVQSVSFILAKQQRYLIPTSCFDRFD